MTHRFGEYGRLGESRFLARLITSTIKSQIEYICENMEHDFYTLFVDICSLARSFNHPTEPTMAVHALYTVFDDSADRSRSDCPPNSVFAQLDLTNSRGSGGSLWWKLQPSEYLSFHRVENDGSGALIFEHMAIKYSLKPNLVCICSVSLAAISAILDVP